MRRTLAVVSAGLRQPSSTRMLADRLAGATRRELERLGAEVDAHPIELREHAHDLVNNLLLGYPSRELQEVHDTVARADALIVVTPTFAASYSGLFKTFTDVLDETALVDKPVLIAATGGTGRHSLVLEHALRPLFSYLRAVVVPTAVFAAPEDWGDGGTAQGSLVHRIDRAAGELAREADRRDPPTINDPFADPTPFEDLLGG
ncbi:NADPH-dependent FMN reductase [Actinomadura craniellae]|uniref:NADPH-dependent FMN reductase n=1 Tax=Actinomadura craniellae TaxID=2231787 RepID=A0A365H3L1_9ACTN|nr:FMN reductase [Actinomadura craniellae]RAY13687.1 NADPH-dependent FMN reductase [Actinomadura craniellae]